MNQVQLINEIAAQAANDGVSKATVKHVLDAQSEVVAREIQKGEGAEVTLPGIGKLSVKQSPARIERNPATGEEIQIPARNKPHFSAAKALKDASNSN